MIATVAVARQHREGQDGRLCSIATRIALIITIAPRHAPPRHAPSRIVGRFILVHLLRPALSLLNLPGLLPLPCLLLLLLLLLQS